MFTYVINADGNPLMPTERCGKVRRLLKEGKAIVSKRCPFTIQLLYQADNNLQEISLGVDAGSKTIGVSATTENKVLYEGEVQLRTDVVDLLSTRREARRARRNRKTRYRQPRFDNRKKEDGWLAPSIRQKIETHFTVINKIREILPISKINVETASFYIQTIKNPEISGQEYQQGNQLGFWNVREYVLFRDGHKCQCCKGKSKDKILNVHHIESRKTGGDAPNNLITLCETCHMAYHAGTVKLPSTIKRGMKFADAAFMGIMRWAFYNKLKDVFPNTKMTFGYITKNTRIENNLPKEHYVDARCISGNPLAKDMGYYFVQKKTRCHNRSLHKFMPVKGGKRLATQTPYITNGFRLHDKVKFQGKEYFVMGRKQRGAILLKNLSGEFPGKSGEVTFRKIKLIEKAKTYMTERKLIPSMQNVI